jgi:hypothetical protein
LQAGGVADVLGEGVLGADGFFFVIGNDGAVVDAGGAFADARGVATEDRPEDGVACVA